jgi:hypothetical protein
VESEGSTTRHQLFLEADDLFASGMREPELPERDEHGTCSWSAASLAFSAFMSASSISSLSFRSIMQTC